MLTLLPNPSYTSVAGQLPRTFLGEQVGIAVFVAEHLVFFPDEPVLVHHAEDLEDAHRLMRMWKGYEPSLVQYAMTLERAYRPYFSGEKWHHDLEACVAALAVSRMHESLPPNIVDPWWLGSQPFHAGHRSYLCRTCPDIFKSAEWFSLDFHPIVWPGGRPGW